MTESAEKSPNSPPTAEHPEPRRWRNVVAAIVALVFLVNLSGAIYVGWLSTTITDEDKFVSTFEPLLQDEAVAEALSLRLANGVVEATDMAEFMAEVAPDRLEFLAIPLTRAVRDQIAEIANGVITSDGATTVWSTALRTTHKAVSAVLTGNDAALVAEDGQVALDVNVIVDMVVNRLGEIGLDLPDTDFQIDPIVLYESDQLASAQSAARLFGSIGLIVWLILLILAALAIWIATDRRWIVAFIGFGGAIVALIDLAGLRIARTALLDGTHSEVVRAARESVWDHTAAPLVSAGWAVFALFLIAGIIAWARGPSENARRLSASTSGLLNTWRGETASEPSPFAMFVADWKRVIQVLLVALGFLFLLFGPAPSGLVVILTAGVVVGVLGLIEIVAGPSSST